MCDTLALRLTNVLDPTGRSIVVDLAAVSALVDAGLALLETGIAVAVDDTEPDSED